MSVETADRARRVARRAARREALAGLVGRLRRLIDAAVRTDVEPDVVAGVAAEVERLEAVLSESRHEGAYSGLVGDRELDPERPAARMPLSPFAGELNPIAPPLELRYEGDRLLGTVVLGKAYVGPPGVAHGGVVAGLMDQMVAAVGQRFEAAGVTAQMTVEFRHPTPLGVRLDLAAWLEPPDDPAQRTRRVHAEIRHAETVTVTAEARIVVVPGFQGREPGEA